MFRHRIIIWFLLSGAVLGLTSCSERKLHNAQAVVAAADSLRAVGQTYTDSLNLAEAYRTLGNRSRFYPDDYAHACYHYGRLLREKDNPVEAMQVFINATHSRSRDHHILGRIYSNMGSLCHLAGEYDLSFDMYKRSANMFLLNGDTLLYYCGVYRMAFEKAEAGDSVMCMSLLQTFKYVPEMYSLSIMTKAELYLQCHQYENALSYANILCAIDNHNSIGLLIKAQSFSFLQIYDSASYYASIVLKEKTSSLYDVHNALYIITNDDATKNKDEIRQAAAKRADIQMILKDRQGQLSQAVQLLEQDLHPKPDWRWLYSALVTLFIIGIIITSILLTTRTRRAEKNAQLEQVKLQIVQKTEEKEVLTAENDSLRILSASRMQDIYRQLDRECDWMRTLSNLQLKEQMCWTDYNAMRTYVNSHMYGFIDRLCAIYPTLKEREIRMCVLVLIGINNTHSAELLCYAKSGIRKYKSTLAKKMGISGTDMRSDLIKLLYK